MAISKRKRTGGGGSSQPQAKAARTGRGGRSSDTIAPENPSTTGLSTSQANPLAESNNMKLAQAVSLPSFKQLALGLGLDPEKGGDDIVAVDMAPARLPNNVFWSILQDLRAATHHHGDRDSLADDEASFRTIFPYFNYTISLFSGVLLNVSNVPLEKETRTSRWVERIYAVGGARILLIAEAKRTAGFLNEDSDYMAQMIDRCSAISSANSRDDFDPPITAILAYETCFRFLLFYDCHIINGPIICEGRSPNNSRKLMRPSGPLPWYATKYTNTQQTVLDIRSACEYIYAVIFKAYYYGLCAQQGKLHYKVGGHAAHRTQEVVEARYTAWQALQKAMDASSHLASVDTGDIRSDDVMPQAFAEEAVELLSIRYLAERPPQNHQIPCLSV
ncbi:hypothetical protein FQN54_008944 [Arachnomyces sp. PD_36]|nr:hypothetical protein FQN54_008944 [Arachnomyces sp. PD_36]